ncbi:signal peptidase I [Murimonas intestini]|uniref:Signal peptidase I n=1 Tax=Murimonas intestini TaxID=1337051 RepID=A0AB73T5C9_9FIRM|nr:signal peptidase I [Murimonas intestini]MCR1840819.1 signal peptidase I [Murimonas intestini]MCR1865130.1 signal peptidase I [Murimonas intestini]MCR1883159.1 signal peptidase I [Murimonas intestini]
MVERERRRKNVPEKPKKSVPKVIFGWTFQIIVVIMFAYVLVYFFGQTRTNIGQSMDTTLSGGDTVLLNEMSYRLGGPKRNDVIAFKPNGSANSHSYIKRVVGLPGETIQIRDGMIYINDKIYLEKKDYTPMTEAGLAEEPIVLGTNEYFVLGDNRNNSEDSRFADIGLVKKDDIEGRVWFVISPWENFGFVK